MKNEKLCLIGCGWLGKPLAKQLVQKGYKVLATTKHDKASEFENSAISYMSLDLSEDLPLPLEILRADVLIYTIPPLELPILEKFFNKIPSDKKIIFTSSTSVYGKNLGDVDETFELSMDHTNSKLLLETENYLRHRFSKLCILRPGGLYGEKRHPIYFLQGKKDVKGGQEFLHLVHLEDCLSAISAILSNDKWNEIYNLVSDLRIPKRDYYTEIALKLSLVPPEYSNCENKMIQTRISNEKSKTDLKIQYLDPRV